MMKPMTDAKIAVIGAGNVGCALAAHLTLLGIEVRLCNRSTARLEQIAAAGGITVTGAVEGFASLAMLTAERLARAVETMQRRAGRTFEAWVERGRHLADDEVIALARASASG